MTKRTGNRQETQEGSGGGRALPEVIAPLVSGMAATRAHLLDWVHACGVAALDAVFRGEAEAVAGPKGQHQAGRTHHHWGTTLTELTLGGRRIQVRRPRVRRRDGPEVTLPAVAAFRARDPLSARVLEQILLGVSTRGYAASLEAGPVGVPSRGTSRSAVSRTLIRRTREQLRYAVHPSRRAQLNSIAGGTSPLPERYHTSPSETLVAQGGPRLKAGRPGHQPGPVPGSGVRSAGGSSRMRTSAQSV